MQLGLLLSETKVDHEECPDGVDDAIKDIGANAHTHMIDGPPFLPVKLDDLLH